MSFFQKVFTVIFPTKWAQAMEADSRSWMVRCPCGLARSVWELGGIRWKASGKQHWFVKCPKCGKRSWHKVTRDQ